MDFHVRRDALSAELGRMSSITEKKSSLPLLENVLIKSDGGKKIKLTATNVETTLYSELLTDQIEVEGAVCVKARKLYDIVRLMPEGLLHITKRDNFWIDVVGGESEFHIPGIDPTYFVDTPAVADLTWIDVPAKHFKNIIDGIEFALAPEGNTQYILSSAKLEMDGTEVRMCATDGHRLSLATGPFSTLMLDTIDVMLPAPGITQLSRMLSDVDGNIGLAKDANHTFFRVGERLLATRLPTGDFPQYRLVFDAVKGYEKSAKMKASDLMKSIKRAMVVADSVTQAVNLNFAGGDLFINTESADAGQNKEVLRNTGYDGDDITTICNGKYLEDFLSVLGTEDFTLEMKDATSQLHCRGEKEGVNYSYILMPMR